MRGDGAKAKDITPIPQPPDSPPSGVPQNIPYPSLASNGQFTNAQWPTGGLPSPSSPAAGAPGLASRTRTLSGAASEVLGIASGGAASAFTRSATSAAQPSGGRFFSSLGRKNSKRSAPAGISMTSTQSGGNSGIPGPRTLRGNISGPLPSPGGGNPNPRRSFDLLSSSQDSPGPALGISPAHSPSSPFPKAESPSSSPTTGSQSPFSGARSPLGPRAPGSQPLTSSPGLNVSQDNYLTLDRRTSATSSQDHEGNGSLAVQGGGTISRRGSSTSSGTPTDYASEKRGSPSPSRSREDSNSSISPAASPSLNNNPSNVKSSFSYGSVRRTGGIGGGNGGQKSDAFEESLAKLSDVLPDADMGVLAEYLRKANGDDLAAIVSFEERRLGLDRWMTDYLPLCHLDHS